jgi:hypothetical protein
MRQSYFLFFNNQPKGAGVQHQKRQRLKVAGCGVDVAEIKGYDNGKCTAAIVTGLEESNADAAKQ